MKVPDLIAVRSSESAALLGMPCVALVLLAQPQVPLLRAFRASSAVELDAMDSSVEALGSDSWCHRRPVRLAAHSVFSTDTRNELILLLKPILSFLLCFIFLTSYDKQLRSLRNRE